MADDDVAAERARLETIAWGGTAPEDEAARARVALQAMGRPGGTPRLVRPSSAPGRSAPEPSVVVDATADVAQTATAHGPGATLAGGPGATTDPTSAAGTGGPGGPDDRGARVAEAPVVDGAGSSLPVGTRTWRTARELLRGGPRVWIALGAVAAVGVAFAAGTFVGTARQEPAAAPSVTPSAGTISLEDLLDAPQTYADQLPGPVQAPVSLHSTRLVFTNRALDGGSFATPWSVWAGVGTDRSTICLVATANRIESTSACYPRADALHGSVSLSAQSMSGTLTLTLQGGGVQGTVTNEN